MSALHSPGLILALTAGVFTCALALSGLGRSTPWKHETLAQFMAFPLYTTAAWLIWRLGTLTNRDAMALTLTSLVLLTLGVWLLKRSEGRIARIFAVMALASSTGMAELILK